MGSVQGKEVDGVLFMEKSKINDLNMGNNSKPGLKFVTVPTSTAVVSRAYVFLCNVQSDNELSNSYTTGCQPVCGDNPRASASGLSYV